MKCLLACSLVCTTLVGGYLHSNGCLDVFSDLCCTGLLLEDNPGATGEDGVQGRFVELRSASVFAGACHFNSEVDHQGRRALIGWSIDSGSWNGVALDGLSAVAAIGSDVNLSRDGERTSAVWIDDRASDAQRQAMLAWLATSHGESLGCRPASEHSASIDLSITADGFALDVPGVARAKGASLQDRACCSMPENVWYEAMGGSLDVIVGQAEICRFEGIETIDAWTHQDQNNAFVGRFEDSPSLGKTCSADGQGELVSLCCDGQFGDV